MADGVGGVADRTDAADRADGAAAGEATIREQARDLRRAGRSVAQIATTLGGVPTSTVQSWVVGVPPPSWTRRPRAKDAERERARQLRREGSTYDEIARQLSVSKSSVSLWTRDLPHPEHSPDGVDARLAALRRYSEARRERVAAERAIEVAVGEAALGRLSDRELLIAGVVAYWAEGANRNRGGDRTASLHQQRPGHDPALADLSPSAGLDDNRLRFRLSIHESADVEASTRWWSEIGPTSAEFQRPTLKRNVVATSARTSARAITAAW